MPFSFVHIQKALNVMNQYEFHEKFKRSLDLISQRCVLEMQSTEMPDFPTKANFHSARKYWEYFNIGQYFPNFHSNSRSHNVPSFFLSCLSINSDYYTYPAWSTNTHIHNCQAVKPSFCLRKPTLIRISPYERKQRAIKSNLSFGNVLSTSG